MNNIVDKYQSTKVQEHKKNGLNGEHGYRISFNKSENNVIEGKEEEEEEEEEEDIDALFDALEDETESDDAFLRQYRANKMDEFQKQIRKIDNNFQSGKFGKINEMSNENELMSEITNSTASTKNKSVIFFYLPDFQKCEELESYLVELSEQLLNTIFYKINVTNCPFLVSKFDLKVLPCCISYDSRERGSKILNKLIGLPQFNKLEYTMHEALIDYLKLD